MSLTIEGEVEALEGLDLEELRVAWRARFGRPPAMRSPELVRRMLAWRIQIQGFGDLDAETKRRLRRPLKSTPEVRYRPGVVLCREYGGRRYQVEVTADGFVYDGVTHKSLSSVARTITGVRWNGPRFFGLQQAKS